MPHLRRIGAEEQRCRRDAIAVDNREVQGHMVASHVPRPRQLAPRIAEHTERVVLRVANERRNATLHALLLEQGHLEVDNLPHLVRTPRAQPDVEHRERLLLLLAVHVDQPQTIAGRALGWTVVPDVASVVAEGQRGGAILVFVQRAEELNGCLGQATRRHRRALGEAQIEGDGHSAASRPDGTTSNLTLSPAARITCVPGVTGAARTQVEAHTPTRRSSTSTSIEPAPGATSTSMGTAEGTRGSGTRTDPASG